MSQTDRFGMEIPVPPKLKTLPEFEDAQVVTFWGHVGDVATHLISDLIASSKYSRRELVGMFLTAAAGIAAEEQVTHKDMNDFLSYAQRLVAYFEAYERNLAREEAATHPDAADTTRKLH